MMMKLAIIFILTITTTVRNAEAEAARFRPADEHRIVCGASHSVTVGDQVFIPDRDSFPSGSSQVIVGVGDDYNKDSSSSSSSSSPFSRSVRTFSRASTYHFRIRQLGRHWIRLHFHPIRPHLVSVPLTVLAAHFVLLNNHTTGNYSSSTFEFSVNLTSPSLPLTFVPSNNTVTFINAIEIVSVPDDLIPDQALAVPANAPFPGLSGLALQTVRRLNVGGPVLSPSKDTLGRTWDVDPDYLHVNSSAVNVSVDPETITYPPGLTELTAPRWVYSTADVMGDANVSDLNFNMTWVFQVDPGFLYLLRLHFCDVFSPTMNTLVFNVYVNSDLAIPSLDLSALKGALSVPYYKDFVANATQDGDLSVSVGPDNVANLDNAILNGLEIMKISNYANSLDGFDSVTTILPPPSSMVSDRKKKLVATVIGLVVATSVMLLFIFVFYCCCFVFRSGGQEDDRRSQGRRHSSHQSWLPLPIYGGGGNSHTISKVSMASQKSGTASLISLPSINLGRVFSFTEIIGSTNKFDENLLLGVGGFGKVYQGTLEDGTKVAVKRGNSRSEQGLAEFHTEIEMLSKLRHRHLVSLIGYCDERSEMILVYEYMANGPLRSHLYGANLPTLSWKQRLRICIGAAKGLHYLHTGASQSIIHRDVKTTNILLDENFVAKVADFGLSKTGPALDQTHVSTAVKGSFGYLDPEYFRRQQLTEKSDVYSFGVVLLEVLCSRPALNPGLPREQVNIAEWAMTCQKKGMLYHIMDPALVGKVSSASLNKYGETTEKCLVEQGTDRPTMGDVLWNLEYALQLEEASSIVDPDENSTNHISGIPLARIEPLDNSVSIVEAAAQSRTDNAAAHTATSAVFSQLVNPRGR